MHKASFARLVLVWVLLIAASFAHAQGACEAPGEFDFTPQVCPNGQGSASSRYGPDPGYEWATYQWTVTGGTIISGANSRTMYYTAGPSGNVEITLSVTSASCSGTRSHTAIITADQNADIHSNSTACPTARSAATVMYGDANSTYSWSITNGTFVGPTNGSNVQFIAGSSGVVGLDVVVSNPNSCNGTGHLDIPITPPQVTIETWNDEANCPGSSNGASAYGGYLYGGTFHWTAQNATIVGSPNQQTVQYVPTGTDPVTLTVTTGSPDGCNVTATRTINLTQAPLPQIVSSVDQVCPNGQVTFTVTNAAQFTYGVRWEHVNANVVSQTADSITLTPADPNYDVFVTAFGRMPQCETSARKTIPVGLPDATISAPQSVCPATSFLATVPDGGLGTTYEWELLGDGLIIGPTNERGVTVSTDNGPGMSRLRARVFNASAPGCDTVEFFNVEVGAELKPTIHVEQPFCGTGTASVDNAPNYTTVAWSISGGVITGAADGPTVNFSASGPVTLTATVTGEGGCTGSNSTTVSPSSPLVPTIAVSPSSLCSTGYRGNAYVTNGPFTSPLEWTFTNAVFIGYYAGMIEFENIEPGPVVVQVSTTDANGCPVIGSATIPYTAPATPVIATTPAEHCGISSTIQAQVTNASVYQQSGMYGFDWFVNGGYVVSSSGPTAIIQPTSNAPVEITSHVWFEGCNTQSTTTVQPGNPSGTPPAITFDRSSVCPNGTAMASAPEGYSSYAWSIENGWIQGSNNNPYVYFMANGAGPVQVSVAVGNPSGCPITGTGSLPLSSVAPPVVTFGQPDACPNGPGSAYVEPANWTNYSWSIVNGTLQSGSNNPYVYYTANGNGPVQLTVQAWTSDNCTASTTVTQPLRTTAAPVVTFGQADACPNGPGAAYVEPANWTNYSWSIVNGTLQSGSNNPYIYYTANGNGPVQVTVQAWTSENCTGTTTATQPLRTTAAPVVTFGQADVCPNGPGAAYVEPANWTNYAWSIVNGTLQSGTNNPYIYYTANGNGPVEVTVQAWTSENCTASTTATQPLRTTAAPVITFGQPDVCPTGPGAAYVEPANWTNYAWSIVNGTLTSGSNNPYIYYTANGNGPVEVTVQAWTSEYCSGTSTATQPLRATSPPVITLDQPSICPSATGAAYAEPGNWTSYAWSIVNGTLQSAADNNYIYYTANGNGPVQITLQAMTSENCSASSTVTQPLATIATPTLQIGPEPTVCPNGTGSAYVPEDYASYTWSVQNGSILNTSWDNKSIMFGADGTGPVTVTVQVTSAGGCTTSNSATVPLTTIAPPEMIVGPQPDMCAGGTSSAYVPGEYAAYTWSIQNGTILSTSADNKSVIFNADGTGAVIVSVTVTTGAGCSSSNSATIPLRTIEPPVITTGPQGSVCAGGSGSAFVAEDYASYVWSIQNGTITSTSADGKSIIYTPSGAGSVVVSVTVMSVDGCTNSNSATIPLQTIDPPAIVVGPQPDVCPNGNSSAFAPGDYAAYDWDIQNGTITSTSADGRSVMFTANASGSVVLSLTVVSTDGCSATNSATVPLRSVTPATVTASGATTFCDGGSVTLTANDATAYQWSNGATTQSITVTSSGSYSVITTDAGYCQSTSAPVTVTVEPAINATITSAAAICEGSTGSASVADAGSGAQYQWSITNGTILSGNGTTSITYAPAAGASSVGLSVSITRGTCAASSSNTVTVNPRPAFTIVATPKGGDYELRDGEEAALTASPETSMHSQTVQMCGVTAATLRASVFDASWTYVWSNGQNGPVTEVNAAGTYTLTATNANGCSSTESVTVVFTPVPTAAISGNTTLCPGGSTTLTASGGSSYLWSTGATTPSITVSAPGQYSVQVTQDGCSSSAYATVTQASSAVTASGPTTFCHGDSVTLTAAPAQSYLWSNGATTQSITVTASGTFTVQQTFEGCTLTSDPVVVSVGPSAVSIAVDDTTACPNQTLHFTSSVTGGTNLTYEWFDGNNVTLGNGTTLDVTPTQAGYGHVTLRVTDGNGCIITSERLTYYSYDQAPPVITPSGPTTFCQGGSVVLEAPQATSYLWSTGETSRWITVSAPGSYTVRTEGIGGCLMTSDPVTVTVNPLPTASITGPASFCDGGSATLTAPAGYTYSWSNGADTQSITVSSGGTYTVTITNANGCSSSASHTVTMNALPTASISGPTSFCDGGSATLTAPAGYTYAWSTGADTQSITVTDGGTYTVTITNANGCSASASHTVSETPLPTASISGPTSFCDGGSATLTAPAGYTYAWSTGANTQSITVSDGGTYSVTITNANGCSASASHTVTENALPVASISGPTSFCDGGSATLTAPAGYTYSWSNGATSQSITVSDGGNYTVTITNANGCSASASHTVTENALPVASITGPTSFCDGGNATLTAPAGYSYSWSTGETTQSITVSDGGNYTVTITNANGCSASASHTVTETPLPTASISGPASFCDGGSATLTAPAGYTYSWSTGETTQSITVTNGGNYTVTITNANGCSASASHTVTETPLPTASISGPTSFCDGGNAALTAPAGYTYSWSTGATSQSITVTDGGNYTVTITNASGCSASASHTVTETPLPTASISGPASFCDGGSATLTAPAGYTYSWSTGETTQSIAVTDGGNYTVTITNANGCSASASHAIAETPLPAASISGPTSFCAGGNATLTAPAGYTYSWSTGASSQSITVTEGDIYTVTITNANGCSASASHTVTKNPLPTASISGPASFCDGGSATLTAPAGYTYSWSTGASSQSITVTEGGPYTVTITNANGCSASASHTIAETPLPPSTITGSTSYCPGGSTTLSAPAGYTYSWSTGESSQSITVNSAATYTVTVTNANGCSSSSSVAVTANAPTAISTNPQSATIPRNTPHTLSVVATGTAPLLYQWYQGNAGDTSQALSGQTSSTLALSGFTKKGTYRYWVRVSSGTCTSTANSTAAVITVVN